MPDDLNYASREKLLLERLQAAPVVEVHGVVGPQTIGGIKMGGQPLTLYAYFAAWRIKGQELQANQLTIRRQVAEMELAKLMRLFHAYDVVRIAARVVKDTAADGPQARLEDFLGSDPADEELNAIAEQLQLPVLFEDAQLGTFEFDRGLNDFGTEIDWMSEEIELVLDAAEPAEVDRAAAAARSLWQDEVGWDRRIRAFAASELLPLKNESWLREGEAKVTAEEFAARLSLQLIRVQAEGTFEFWFDDDDMFWCHSITVDGNTTDGPTDASIQG
jgi:hypothetical protein